MKHPNVPEPQNNAAHANRAKLRECTILLLVCTILLAGTVAIHFYKPALAASVATAKTYSVSAVPVAQAAALVISNENGVYGLVLDGANVRVTGAPSNADYNQTELRAAVYALCNMNATREIQDLQNLEHFGFGSPKARLSIITKNGQEHLFALLNQNPADNSYYLFSEDTQTVYVIPEFTASILLKNPSGFFEKRIFYTGGEKLPAVERMAVTYRNAFTTADGKLAVNYEITAANENCTLIKPFKQTLNAVHVHSAVMLPLLLLQAESVSVDDENAGENEFNSPDITIDLFFDGVRQTVLLVKQGSFYRARHAGKNTVYHIARENLAFLEDNIFSLFDGNAFYIPLGGTRELNISFGAADYTLSLTGSATDLSGTFKGKKIDFEQLYRLFETINNAKIAGHLQNQAEKKEAATRLATPDIRIEAAYDTGTRDVIEIAAAKNGVCAVRVNGEINFTIPAALSQTIKSAFALL